MRGFILVDELELDYSCSLQLERHCLATMQQSTRQEHDDGILLYQYKKKAFGKQHLLICGSRCRQAQHMRTSDHELLALSPFGQPLVHFFFFFLKSIEKKKKTMEFDIWTETYVFVYISSL